ncbi:MAG: NAD-binding protein, partial [Deltaproteobacteria bacterium]
GLAHKDMKLSKELAQSLDAELPMCEMVEDLYKRAVEKYGFDQNHLMAVKLLEEANQTFLRGS